MSQADPAFSGGRDRRYVVTTGVVERLVAERPTKDSPDAVAEWLVGAAIPTGLQAFDEFSWRMLATGLPLLRVTLHSGTLHPQFLGTTFIWWRTSVRASDRVVSLHGLLRKGPNALYPATDIRILEVRSADVSSADSAM